jgi:hypothetical protein
LCAASTQPLWACGKTLLRDVGAGFLVILYGRVGEGPGHRVFWVGVPWSGPVEPVGYRLSCPSAEYDMGEGGDRSNYTCVQRLSNVLFTYSCLQVSTGFLVPLAAVLRWTTV